MVRNIMRSQVDDHLYLSEQLDSVGIGLNLSPQRKNRGQPIDFKIPIEKSLEEKEKENFRLQFQDDMTDPVQEFNDQLIENLCQE